MVLRINFPQLTFNVVGITYLLHFEAVMYIYLLILQFLVDLGSKFKLNVFSRAEIHQEFSESKLSFHEGFFFGDFLGLNFLNEFLKKVINLLLGF